LKNYERNSKNYLIRKERKIRKNKKAIAIFGSGVYIIYIGFSSVVLAGGGHWKGGNLY